MDTKNKKRTFISSAFKQFKGNFTVHFAKMNNKRIKGNEYIYERLSSFHDWMSKNIWAVLIVLALVIYLGLLGWFVVEWICGKVQGNAVQTGVGGLIGAGIVGLVVSPVCALIVSLCVFIINFSFKLLAPLVLFFPLALWSPAYAVYQLLIVLSKLLLMIPLSVLIVLTRFVQLVRRIFHVCPYRNCAYRGYPIHVCPECGSSNYYLWPNLYGLFKHECTHCGNLLPTLYYLGRKDLMKRCGRCEMPLMGTHVGRVPVRPIGIVGGTASGKTNFLLMAVKEILAGQDWIRGELNSADQLEEFNNDLGRLEKGIPADKTVEVSKAFLLYSKVARTKCQLYLYDSPGEDFATIQGMDVHQYFGLMEGFILMVDPLVFSEKDEALREDNISRFQNVVHSTLNRILSEKSEGDKKISMRVAIIISKADLHWVKKQIGDIEKDVVASEICRQAIIDWGGGNVLRAIELHFETVKYFACSPLGRDPVGSENEPFCGTGVLEPLKWILTKERG